MAFEQLSTLIGIIELAFDLAPIIFLGVTIAFFFKVMGQVGDWGSNDDY